MPNILSAKKRVKLSTQSKIENKNIRTKLKTVIKNFYSSDINEIDILNKNFKLAIKTIDKAVTKNIIHKNNGSRKKHKLHLKLNNITTLSMK